MNKISNYFPYLLLSAIITFLLWEWYNNSLQIALLEQNMDKALYHFEKELHTHQVLRKVVDLKWEYESKSARIGSFESLKDSTVTQLRSLLKKDDFGLIFRFFDVNCMKCVKDNYQLIKESGMLEKTVFLSNYESVRNTLVLEDELGLSSIYFERKLFEGESNEYPYLCLFDRKGNISHFFIPDDETDNYTSQYLNQIKKIIEHPQSHSQ